jgi:hypothetical protein
MLKILLKIKEKKTRNRISKEFIYSSAYNRSFTLYSLYSFVQRLMGTKYSLTSAGQNDKFTMELWRM